MDTYSIFWPKTPPNTHSFSYPPAPPSHWASEEGSDDSPQAGADGRAFQVRKDEASSLKEQKVAVCFFGPARHQAYQSGWGNVLGNT